MKMTKTTIAAITTIPPITPPTIAPVEEFLLVSLPSSSPGSEPLSETQLYDSI